MSGRVVRPGNAVDGCGRLAGRDPHGREPRGRGPVCYDRRLSLAPGARPSRRHRTPRRPHRPEAQDAALSRPKHGFESRWGRQARHGPASGRAVSAKEAGRGSSIDIEIPSVVAPSGKNDCAARAVCRRATPSAPWMAVNRLDRCVRRAPGPTKSSARESPLPQSTRRGRCTTVAGYAARGRSSHLRSRAERDGFAGRIPCAAVSGRGRSTRIRIPPLLSRHLAPAPHRVRAAPQSTSRRPQGMANDGVVAVRPSRPGC